jgi:hypothetical protein
MVRAIARARVEAPRDPGACYEAELVVAPAIDRLAEIDMAQLCVRHHDIQ